MYTKTSLFLFALLFASCVSINTQREPYKIDAGDVINIYEIRISYNNGKFESFFSLMRPNMFYYVGVDSTIFILYFEDANRKDIYVSEDVLLAFDVRKYSILEDLDVYADKREELIKYLK